MNNQEIIDKYAQGAAIAELARENNMTKYKMKKFLIENNVQIRTRQEQTVLTNMKRGKKINHNYFDVLNNENTYYLGFIAADGTIRKDKNAIKIALSSIDKDFLENFRNKIKSERELSEYQTQNGFSVSELSFSSLKIKQELAKYSIVPNKTFIGITMKNIPDNLKIFFIKGFFDGDGCFTYNKNTNQCKIEFCSHKKGILTEIYNFFGLKGTFYQDNRNVNPVYYLSYSTKSALKIMQIFYSNESPCLERKKQKYENFLKIRI